MRAKVLFTKNTVPVPITKVTELLNSYVHRCLGENNEYHNTFSEYSICSLQGGKLDDNKKTLNFEDGMYIYISVPPKNMNFFNQLVTGMQFNKTFGYGMEYSKIEIITMTVGKYFDYVQTICPILLFDKRNETDIVTKKQSKRLCYNDENWLSELEERTRKKLSHYDENINLNGFKITLVDNGHGGKNKVKRIQVKSNLTHKASMVRLKVEGNKRTREILYDLGFGSSTGSGFGSVIIIATNSTSMNYT